MSSDPTDRPDWSGGEGVETLDPFAVDLFASAERLAQAEPAEHIAAGGPDVLSAPVAPWHAALPQVSADEARLSGELAALPSSLSEEVAEAFVRVLGRHAGLAPGEARVEVVHVREADASQFAAEAEAGAPRVFLRASIEPDGAPLVLVADAHFASAVVDRLLGGEGAQPNALHALSTTELAVFEFLAVSVAGELNALLGEPLFQLESVGGNPPATFFVGVAEARLNRAAETAARRGGTGGRVVVLTARVQIGAVSWLVRALFGREALSALSADDNRLLARDGAGRAPAALLRRFTRDAPLRLVIGETVVGSSDLLELEAGDVVLVERLFVRPGGGADGARVRAGAGRNVHLVGRVQPLGTANGDGAATVAAGGAGALAFVFESVAVGDRGDEAGRLTMVDESGSAEGAEGAEALAGLHLTLHVELASRRISLEELSRLRAGQLIELGCRATDPVDLVADDRRVATGELIDIEGRLGVRVTRVLG